MNGEVMTKLHELAKLMRGAVSAGVIKQHSSEVEIIQWADTIDEYLAATPQPTSELVGRLRVAAEDESEHPDALLLEAADALALKQQLIEAVRNRESGELTALAELDEANAKVAELDNALDAARTDAAEARREAYQHKTHVTELERELAEARAYAVSCSMQAQESSGRAEAAEAALVEQAGRCAR